MGGIDGHFCVLCVFWGYVQENAMQLTPFTGKYGTSLRPKLSVRNENHDLAIFLTCQSRYANDQISPIRFLFFLCSRQIRAADWRITMVADSVSIIGTNTNVILKRSASASSMGHR